ncbi:MAG: pilus assembly protein TadG [Alphaproteobacteria bacterium]|nr:pilus assembly protein TadG [Alphaproteobacteria bacterium]
MTRRLSNRTQKLFRDEDGVAAIEAALLFPLLILILLGIVDTGNAVLAGQKTIRASQVTADLIARKRSVTTQDIEEAIEAARLTMAPYDSGTLGVDVVSIEFVEDDDADICWRETTDGMTVDDAILTSVIGLGAKGDGVLAVTVRYTHSPIFSSPLTGPIEMEEIAFVRGRKSPIVERDDQCW